MGVVVATLFVDKQRPIVCINMYTVAARLVYVVEVAVILFICCKYVYVCYIGTF